MRSSERSLVVGAAVFYVPAIAAAVAWIGWRAGWTALGERIVGGSPALALAAGTAAGALLVVASRLLSRTLESARRLEAALRALIGPLSLGACALLALLSSVGEELVFRGALQPEIGAFWSSLIFGAVHVPMERDLRAWPVFAALVGLLLAGLFSWTGSLLAPIAAHAVVNLVNLRYLARTAEDSPRAEPAP